MADMEPGKRPRGAVVVVGGSFWVGVIFLTLGLLWTLDNLGLMNAGEVLRFWPLALVALGVARLTGMVGPQRPVWGAILTGVGALLLLNNFDLIDFGIEELWAIGLIFIGGMIVYRAVKGRQEREATGDTSERLNALAIMAGIERKVESTAFKGGEATAVMGSVELDFRGARIAEGGEASIELLCIMGGMELYVPADWKVEIDAMPVMGAVEDSRKAPAAESRQTLRLRGFVMMGGVEIKDAPGKG